MGTVSSLDVTVPTDSFWLQSPAKLSPRPLLSQLLDTPKDTLVKNFLLFTFRIILDTVLNKEIILKIPCRVLLGQTLGADLEESQKTRTPQVQTPFHKNSFKNPC